MPEIAELATFAIFPSREADSQYRGPGGYGNLQSLAGMNNLWTVDVTKIGIADTPVQKIASKVALAPSNPGDIDPLWDLSKMLRLLNLRAILPRRFPRPEFEALGPRCFCSQ